MANLIDLIARSYSVAEGQRFKASAKLLQPECYRIAEVGKRILVDSPRAAGDCVALSARWTLLVHSELRVPAYCVAGDLRVLGSLAFGSDRADIARDFDASNPSWDGHCWMIVPGYLGDISVFRSADAAPHGSRLKAVVLAQYGPGRGLALVPKRQWQRDGFEHIPKHVLTAQQLRRLTEPAGS